ncbi:hypothetical protein ACFQU2_11780 [Siccirubricoccus deserti]
MLGRRGGRIAGIAVRRDAALLRRRAPDRADGGGTAARWRWSRLCRRSSVTATTE